MRVFDVMRGTATCRHVYKWQCPFHILHIQKILNGCEVNAHRVRYLAQRPVWMTRMKAQHRSVALLTGQRLPCRRIGPRGKVLCIDARSVMEYSVDMGAL